MDAEYFGSLTLISFGLAESGLYEFLLKSADTFVEENSFFDHFRDQGFQLLSQGLPLSCPLITPPFLDSAISFRESRLEIGRRSKCDHPGAR